MTTIKTPVRWETEQFEVAIVSRNEAEAKSENDCCLRSGEATSLFEPLAASLNACYINTSFATVLLVSFLLGVFQSLKAADFVITADLSGSMATPVKAKGGRSRIAVVQEALVDYVRALPNESRLKVITFNDGFGEREVILRSDGDRADLTQWIGSFGPEVRINRGTRLYEAMRRALAAARDYARGNPHQYVEVRILTDGEDSSGVPADRAIPEILGEYPEVDGQSIRMNLVLAGDWSSAMIVRLEEKLRPLGVDVTDAGDFSQPLLPPVIVQAPDPALVGQEALFADNSKTAFVGYEWAVNGNPAGKEKSLKTTFHSAGSQTVELVGITSRGQRLRTRKVVTVDLPKMTADIAFFPATPRVGDKVQFLARVSGDATQFNWFVDGILHSQDKDFSARFDVATTHDVRLSAKNDAGVSVEATQRVAIISRVLRVAFNAPSETVDGEVVQFANETAGEGLTFVWNFGDSHTSTDRNPKHAFTLKAESAESFEVKVSATDETGMTVESPIRHVRVVPRKKELPPVAGFRVEGSVSKVGIPVPFVDESNGLVSDYLYEFDREGTSTNKNPSFSFKVPGQKVIRQRVRGPGGDSWATNRVTITPRFQTPAVITGSVSPAKGRAPLQIKCDAQVAGDYAKVQWRIGTNMLSTNISFATILHAPVQAEIRLVVFPKELGAATVEKVFPVSIKAPMPIWMVWTPVALLAAVAGWLVVRKLRPAHLLGELAWQYAGRTGQTKLTGSVLKLAELQIPGWQPSCAYLLRNKNGHHIFSENGVEMELSHKKTVRLEGVTFTYLNEADTF